MSDGSACALLPTSHSQDQLKQLQLTISQQVEEARATADYEVMEARNEAGRLNSQINLLVTKLEETSLLKETNIDILMEASPTNLKEQCAVASAAAARLTQAMLKVGELMMSGAQLVACDICGEDKVLFTPMPCCPNRMCKACFRVEGHKPCPYCRTAPMQAE